jgi:uncharacterized OsmC-like protein
VRGIELSSDAIGATVEGVNEVRERIPVLTTVHVHYRLRIPPGSREVVDRALERHVSKCPTAQSLAGAVAVTWTADIVEEAG